MMRAAEAQGAELRIGARHRPRARDGTASRGVEVDGGTIARRPTPSSSPWGRGRSWPRGWLPLPAVFGLKGHSLVFETGRGVPAEALFLEYQEARGAVPDARGVPARRRHDLCLRDLQREPAAGRSRPTSRPIPARIERLEAMCRGCSPALAAAKIVRAAGLLPPGHRATGCR